MLLAFLFAHFAVFAVNLFLPWVWATAGTALVILPGRGASA
jgi:hypothetical protein